jgi:GNAT superfamily N-acetyltransferase
VCAQQIVEPEIRPIGPEDDVGALTDLLHRAYQPLAERGMRFLASHQDEETTRRRIARGECFVAVVSGRVVGTVTFRGAAATKGSPWYDRPDVSSFGQFAVEPALQRHGIGTRLLRHVESRARASGAAELACDTAETADHLIRYYTLRGYRFVGHVKWEAVNYRSVVLSKSLREPAGAAGT